MYCAENSLFDKCMTQFCCVNSDLMKQDDILEYLNELHDKYGDIFTVYFGEYKRSCDVC